MQEKAHCFRINNGFQDGDEESDLDFNENDFFHENSEIPKIPI